MNSFLEPHEKIKKLRKKYKITQVELAGDIYTQGYITSLERGIKKPTEKNLINLVERFNQLLAQKKIDDIIYIDDIRKNRIEEEEEFVKKILKELNVLDNKDKFLKKYREVKLKIIRTSEKNQIRVFKELLEISKELECWEEMRDISVILMMKNENNLEKFGEAFLELTRACIYIDDSDFIVPFEETYEKKLEELSIEMLDKIYGNFKFIYAKDPYYEKSLQYLDKLENGIAKKEDIGEILINKAFALKRLNRLEEAKTIYKQVIKKYKDNEILLDWAIQNITAIYIEEDNKKEVRRNYNFLKKNLIFNESEQNSIRSAGIGEIAIYLGKIKEAKGFYEYAMDSLFTEYYSYREDCYVKFFENLLPLYKKKDKEKVKKYEEVFKKLQGKEYIKRSSFAFIKYYNDNKLYNELKEFLKLYKNN